MPEATEGPTVLRILLGTQLRRLRESRGITAQAAARAIRGSESKISRIELGRNAIREIDVLDLLTFYGVGPVEREQLLTLAEQANRPGWWHRFNDILPDWFQPYVGMEEATRNPRWTGTCWPWNASASWPRNPTTPRASWPRSSTSSGKTGLAGAGRAGGPAGGRGGAGGGGWARGEAGGQNGGMNSVSRSYGTGPGVITPDGCAVDFYAMMQDSGEAAIV